MSSKLLLTAALVLMLLCPLLSEGQVYFGKNKVQYTNFSWQVMETAHFRVYFYLEEEELAGIAARIGEDGYRTLASRFKHEVYRKIPLIIYSSPNYFSQTNVIPTLLPESVGGFTEFMKGRVVVPFHGSYHSFAHVIRHELVHVFTLSKLESVMSKQRLMRMASPPLWFIEGIAEYWSTEWDSEADMILKDMVLSGRLYPISRMYELSGTFFMYKLGQSVCEFINDHYGSDKLVLIFENWWKAGDFDDVIKITLGESLKDLSKKWEYHLKKEYFPQIADGGLAKQESEQLTRDGYSLKGVPIVLEDDGKSSEWIVFKANKRGYTGIYMMPPSGEKKKLRTLLKGERSAGFESLHLLQSGIDANNDGKVLFSSKSKESDVLYLYDVKRGRVTNKYEFPGLAAIISPRFSRDARMAVFSGSDLSGRTDIYIVNLMTGDLSRVTDDFYYDTDPVFTADQQSIIFASDRCFYGNEGAINLYRISITGGTPEPITSGHWHDISPEVDNGGVYFSSDRDGAYNIYRLNGDSTIGKITSLLTGAYDPRLSPDNEKLIFSGYQDFGFHIYRTEVTDSVILAANEPPPGKVMWRPGRLNEKFVKSSVRYKTEYSFDIAQSALAFDPVYGSLGGLQVALSDMLGDYAFYFLLTNTAESKDELLSSFNTAVTYINMKNRLNWGLGLFHLYDEYFNDYDGYFNERQVGGLLYLNYPMSKFNRLEMSTYLRYSDKDLWLFQFRRRGALMTNYISLVSDNSLWDISGPIEGHRYNFTLGLTTRLDKQRQYNRIGLLDVRHYLRLGKFSAYASRLFAYSSTGIEPQRLYFGGSWSFRGYDRRGFYARNILFVSNELRFPLIDNLSIGFPFGSIGFSAIRGALFFDAGYITDDRFHLFDDVFFDELLGSYGAGFRVALGRMIVLRFDFSRRTDFTKTAPGTDFEFFFGWNF
ncbi:MAG: PD40 domain-containing protein [Candidatus Zixiibacteriota bacterium]|nr:MAG: PD40 domain-containing protein [candidate division Zixibacteria bacterium]